jgi:transposase
MEKLTATEKALLKKLQKEYEKKKPYIKITLILLLDMNMKIETACDVLGIDVATGYRYVEKWKTTRNESIEVFLFEYYTQYEGKLDEAQKKELVEVLREELHINSQEVVERIRGLFDVEYTASGVVKLLKRLQIVYKKTKIVYAEADKKKQEEFVAEFAEVMEKKKENEVVLFLDSVHFEHHTRSAYGWIPCGEEFKVLDNPGKKRLNVMGAVNISEPDNAHFMKFERVDSEAFILFLKTNLILNNNKKIIIYCDNAPYHKSQKVKDFANQYSNKIEIRYIPPYSPNLNPIERLWKFVRKKVINNYYYKTFEKFKDSIWSFFKDIGSYKKELKTLITPNLRVI